MIPAVSYLRMSRDTQDTSVPAQRQAIANYAAKHGYRILREYVDSGISGDATEKRLQFQKMLKDAARGDFKVVLCWDQDRFGRFDLLEAGWWIKPLRDAGVKLVTVTQGAINWDDFAGRIIYTIQQEGKHQFLRDLSRNVVRGKAKAAQEGKWMGGANPYGYRMGPDKRLVVQEDEAGTVRQIFKLYLAGKSHKQIAVELNRQKIPGPLGPIWYSATIGRMLQNPVYAGHIRYNRRSVAKYSAFVNGLVTHKSTSKDATNDKSLWVIVENTHTPIIDAKQFARAQAERPQRRCWTGGTRNHQIMFKALLRCAACGHKMHGAWVPGMKDVVYVCSLYWQSGECSANRAYQKPLLQLVRKELNHRSVPAAIERAKNAILARLKGNRPTAAKTLETRLKRLETQIAKGTKRLIDVPPALVNLVSKQIQDWQTEVDEVRGELAHELRSPKDALRFEMAALDACCAQMRKAIEQIDAGPSEQLGRVLRATLDHIAVTTGREPHFITKNGKFVIKKLEIVLKNAEQVAL